MRTQQHRPFKYLARFLLVAWLAAFPAHTLCAAPAASQNLKLEKETAQAINKFAADFYLELVKSDDGNILFSPYALYTTLAMAHAGTNDPGARAIAKAMGFGPNTLRGLSLLAQRIESGGAVKVANGVWPSRKAAKNPALQWPGRGRVRLLNYTNPKRAQNTINDWTKGRTGGFVPEIVPPNSVGKTTATILTSALVFSGDIDIRHIPQRWDFHGNPMIWYVWPFYPNATYIDRIRGTTKSVAVWIFGQEEHARWFRDSNFVDFLGLPCERDKYTLIYAAPTNQNPLDPKLVGKHIGTIFNYEKKIKGQLLRSLRHLLSKEARGWTGIAVPTLNQIPPQPSKALSKCVRDFFMRTKATQGNSFRKNNMVENKIEVFHSLNIKIGEHPEDLEEWVKEQPRNEVRVRVDIRQPFLYLLVDNQSGAILFMGRLVRPRAYVEGER